MQESLLRHSEKNVRHQILLSFLEFQKLTEAKSLVSSAATVQIGESIIILKWLISLMNDMGQYF